MLKLRSHLDAQSFVTRYRKFYFGLTICPLFTMHLKLACRYISAIVNFDCAVIQFVTKMFRGNGNSYRSGNK